MMEFNIPANGNKKLEALMLLVKKDKEIETLLKMSNITAIDRMGYNDHGPTHVRIVANSSLRMLRILMKRKIVPDIVKSYKLKKEDAEIIVVFSAVLHDIGHAIHRKNHELLSTILAGPIIDRILSSLYKDQEKNIIKLEILHTIYSHEPNMDPLTIEGGVMKVADALDMEMGRARIPYQAGSVNIHSVSAMAIDKVKIFEGIKKPIRIIIHMSDSAGIFQVDELLKGKVRTSGIAKELEIEAILKQGKKEKILKKYVYN